MSTRSRDTRTRARLLIDAFIESLVGLFALRLEPVKVAVRSHAPEMSVLSSYEGEHINLQAAQVVDALTTSSAELKTAIEILTAAFVAAMWDLLKPHAHYDKISTKPEIQFLRHLRNACGRDKRLTMADAGKIAFAANLKIGDVVLLFIDIDRQYFEQP